MSPIRKGILVLLAGFVLGFVAGCSTQFKAPVIEPILNALVPADYRGDFSTGEHGQYTDLQIVATDLHRNSDGRWTWNTLRYRQKLTIPLAPGLPYRNEAWVEMPPPPPQ